MQLADIASELSFPPTLEPEPLRETTINVGQPLQLFLGNPTSFKDNDIEVTIDTGSIDFIRFDKDANQLSIEANLTKPADAGQVKIVITLRDKEDDLTEKYTIYIMVIDAPEAEEEKETCGDEEMVCEIIKQDGTEIEECKCPESEDNSALDCENQGGSLVCTIEIDEDEKEYETCECIIEEPECLREEMVCKTELGPDGEEREACECPEIIQCARELICEVKIEEDGLETEVCTCPQATVCPVELVCQTQMSPDGAEEEICECPEEECSADELICEVVEGVDGEELETCRCPDPNECKNLVCATDEEGVETCVCEEDPLPTASSALPKKTNSDTDAPVTNNDYTFDGANGFVPPEAV